MFYRWQGNYLSVCFMVFSVLFLALTSQITVAGSLSPPPFTSSEIKIIKNNLFKNIATKDNVLTKKELTGKVIHSRPGAVMASPSNQDSAQFSQDYQFHWTRDAAITMSEVAYLYSQAPAEEKKRLREYLMNYIQFEHTAQKQVSKPGEQTLGQPKYNLDATVWEGKWNRPQNDGPALRAIALINIAKLFLQEGHQSFVKDQMLNMIMIDLNYITKEWRHSSFGLWEEVNDKHHFYNKMVQRKALIEGSEFMRSQGRQQEADIYLNTAKQLTASLEKHWNADEGYFSETIHQKDYKGGGIDTSILLGILYGELNDSQDPFALTNKRVISTIYYLENIFAKTYRVNINHASHPLLLGRYPSDIYDGGQFVYGNPWVLITNALAQYYYSLAASFQKQGKIIITADNVLFFQELDPQIKLVSHTLVLWPSNKRFYHIINGLVEKGDQTLALIKHYSACYPDHTCYHFAEQLNRVSGKQESAKDLTWGYATLLTAMQARSKLPFH